MVPHTHPTGSPSIIWSSSRYAIGAAKPFSHAAGHGAANMMPVAAPPSGGIRISAFIDDYPLAAGCVFCRFSFWVGVGADQSVETCVPADYESSVVDMC